MLVTFKFVMLISQVKISGAGFPRVVVVVPHPLKNRRTTCKNLSAVSIALLIYIGGITVSFFFFNVYDISIL